MATSRTTRLNQWRWSSDGDTWDFTQFRDNSDALEALAALSGQDIDANRPAAAATNARMAWWSTDTTTMWWSTGAAWVALATQQQLAQSASNDRAYTDSSSANARNGARSDMLGGTNVWTAVNRWTQAMRGDAGLTTSDGRDLVVSGANLVTQQALVAAAGAYIGSVAVGNDVQTSNQVNAARAADTSIVRTTGAQTVAGIKTFSSQVALAAGAALTDGQDVVAGSSTGSRFGGAGAKVALFGTTPAVQPAATADLKAALAAIGIIASAGSATPLNLEGGLLTAYNNAGFGREVQGTAAPTTGTWARGDRVLNTAPAASGVMGWVCVTAGSPGTWKTWGAISA